MKTILLIAFALFISGCRASLPQVDGEIAIRPGRPLRVWRVGDGFAPEVKIVYISADGIENVLFDGLDYPVNPREQRSENVKFGNWQVNYTVAAKTDPFGQRHYMEYTVTANYGRYNTSRNKSIEYDPAHTEIYPAAESGAVVPAASPAATDTGEIKWNFMPEPGSGGRALEITGEVISGGGIAEITTERSGSAVFLRVLRGGAPGSGVRRIRHLIPWGPDFKLIMSDTGETVYPLSK